MRAILLLAPFLLLSAGASHAASEDDRACVDERGQAQIDACTRVIRAGKWRGKDLAWAYGNRGGVYIDLDRMDDAIADLDKSIELDASPNVLDNRGLVRIKQEKYEDAIRDFDRSLQLHSRGVFALHHRAIAYGSLGNYARAVRDFDAALRLDDRDSDLWNNRGYVLLQQGSYKQAIADFDRAIRLNSQHARAYANRGEAKLKLGDIPGSDADYARHQQLVDTQPPS